MHSYKKKQADSKKLKRIFRAKKYRAKAIALQLGKTL